MGREVSGYRPWILPGAQPITTKDFHALTKSEALAFTAAVVGRSTERIVELERLVQSTPGHGSWTADLSRDSLKELGEWVKAHVPVRPPGPGEGWKSFATVPPGVDISKLPPLRARWLISDEGQSMISDAGIYMAEVLRTTHRCWRWTACRYRKGQVAVDQNQPVVAWNAKVLPGFSPFHEGRQFMLQIIERTSTPGILWDCIGRMSMWIPTYRKRHGEEPCD